MFLSRLLSTYDVLSNSELCNRLLLKNRSPSTCANKVEYGITQFNNGMQVDIDSLDVFASYIETVKHDAPEFCHKRRLKITKLTQKTNEQ